MIDPIDRRKAISELKNFIDKNVIDGNTDAYSLLDILVQLPSEWIPVTERLPESSDTVLVTGHVNRFGMSFVFLAFYSVRQCYKPYLPVWHYQQNGEVIDTDVDVLAWMPLPKPFGEEEL